jgi:regulator of sigma E protease
MLYGCLAVLALGILIIVHEWGHYIVARLCKMRVDRFSIGFGPALLRTRRGETEFQVGAIPLGGYVQIAGLNPEDENIDVHDPRAYPNRPAWQRFITIAAGPVINYVFAVLLIFLLHSIIGVYGITAKVVMPNHPAAAAGIQAGDQIYRINGFLISDYHEVLFMVDSSKGKPMQVEVIRNGQLQTITVEPALDQGHYRIGIEMETTSQIVRHPPLDSARQSLYAPFTLSMQTLQGLLQVIRGKQAADFKSPVGIARIMKEQMERGFIRGLQFVAMISTLLGLFNLLPLPALDGGRLVFLGWELVTRRPVSQRVEQVVHLVGMVLLLGLLVILMVKDVRDWILGH